MLSGHSFWKGPALVVSAWAVIIGAGALFIALPNPATYVLAVMLIGARQLGLAILEHDAAHGALHPNAKLNDWMAEWLCGSPVGGSLKRYRPYHLTHHKYTEQPEDPDLVLSRPFPVTKDVAAPEIHPRPDRPDFLQAARHGRRSSASAARRASRRACRIVRACGSGSSTA